MSSEVTGPEERSRRSLSAVSEWFAESYLVTDLRKLALFRIFFGLLLLGDVARRFGEIEVFFANTGVVPNHLNLSAPLVQPYYFSIFNAFSTPAEVKVAFLLTAAVFVCFTVGYRTRAAQVATFVLAASLNSRNIFLENGGNAVVLLLALWTMFLPLGARFSVDSGLRRRRGEGVAPPANRWVSLASLALVLQTVCIYYFNVVHKTGETWTSGQAVHWMLWQNRIATSFAGFLRMHEPAWLSPALVKYALLTEAGACVLVLLPVWQKYARSLSFVLTTGLHVGIATMVNIGLFSYAMLLLNFLLLPTEVFDWAEPRARALWGRFRGGSFSNSEGRGAGLAPAARAVARPRLVLREGALAVLIFVMTTQALHQNRLPAWAKVRHFPEWMAPLVIYPRVFQLWPMFAPDAPKTDGLLVIDAETAAGRRLDPLTGEKPDFDAALHGPWGHSQLWCDYHLKISLPQHAHYRGAFKQYLLNWHKVHERPAGDRLTRFSAYWVENAAPPFGSTTPTDIKKKLLFSVGSPSAPGSRRGAGPSTKRRP